MTQTEPDTPYYDEVLRTRWNNYFYVMACAPLLSFLVLVGAFAFRPLEWKIHPSLEENLYVQNVADVQNNESQLSARTLGSTNDESYQISSGGKHGF